MLNSSSRSIGAFGAALSGAVATLAASGSAVAHETEQREIVVYSDLDLSRPAGAARLSARIANAVHRICGKPLSKPLFEANQQRECAANTRVIVNPRINLADGARGQAAQAIANRTLAQASPSLFPKR